MDTLWKKESNNSGLYVDIFKTIPISTRLECEKITTALKSKQEFHLLAKNNADSSKFRDLGNGEFEKKNWLEAMTFYNKSLCFAEIDTENVSLAYANRSSCFLQLNMFAKCLIDIELAIQAKYAENLMPKLLQSRKKCLELIQNGTPDESEFTVPSLSYEASSAFPEMANVLEIKKNKVFGRLIVATSDIPAGQTILVEKSFATQSSNRDHCHICTRRSMNFSSCQNCTWALFCHDTCAKQKDMHQIDCRESLYELREGEKEELFTWEWEDEIAGMEYGMFYEGVDFLRHSVLQALKFFSSVESFIEFVEDAIQSRTHEIPHHVVDMKSKYRTLLQLNTLSLSYPANLQLAFIAFNCLLQRNDIMEKFNTEQKRRFLMHLLLHQENIIGSNSFNTHDGRHDTFVLFSYFNHSCAPNVLSRSRANMRFTFTLRPIKAGQQLFISYLSDVCGSVTVAETQTRIEKNFGFKCSKCERCQPNEPKRRNNSALMQFDRACQWLELQWEEIDWDRTDDVNRNLLTKTAVEILNRYGSNHWCIELARMMEIYDDLIMWWLKAHRS